ESRDGRITLAVNGKVVSGGSQCKPRKGYICLESEGGPIYFRDLRIQELPSSNPPTNEVASLDQGFKSIYNGLDLNGLKGETGHEGHWKAKDWILDYDGKSEAQEKSLWTEKAYGDFIMIVDWRLSKTTKPKQFPFILANGDYATNREGARIETQALDAGDS